MNRKAGSSLWFKRYTSQLVATESQDRPPSQSSCHSVAFCISLPQNCNSYEIEFFKPCRLFAPNSTVSVSRLQNVDNLPFMITLYTPLFYSFRISVFVPLLHRHMFDMALATPLKNYKTIDINFSSTLTT